MKRLAIALLLVISFPLTARADDASRHAKATEMVNLLHLEQLQKQMMDGMLTQMNTITKQMASGKISAEQQAKLDQFQQKVFALIEAQISWKEMQPVYVDLYAKTFTDDELDGILVFYKSPAGAAMISKLPALTAEAQQISQKRIAAIQPQLMQMVQDLAKDAAQTSKPQ